MTLPRSAAKILALLSKQMSAYVAELEQALALDPATIEAAALELRRGGMITVDGPPNGNSDLGMDIDRLEITALGYMTAQSAS